MGYLKDTIIRTRERPIQGRIRIIENIDERLQTCVQSTNVQEQRHHKDSVVQAGESDLSGVGELRLPVEMQPHNARQPEGEPRDENRRGDVEDGAEDRDSVGDHKRHDPEQRAKTDPKCPREAVVHIDLLRAHLAHDSNVHVLDSRDADDETRAEDGRDQDTVRNLRGDSGCGAERRGRDSVASKTVNNARDNDVDDDLEGLLHEQRGREFFLRVAHLGHDAHKGLVTGEGEGDVEERVDGFDEVGFAD